MGTLLYGLPPVEIELTDRELAHLKVVILTKLRRSEMFPLAVDGRAEDTGRRVLWIHPAIPLQFRFDALGEDKLNRIWLEELMASANSGGSLRLGEEPAERS
ncbi:hypothetical protein IWX78_001008 [Mycetocola sp. CAN_C7]|uniref:DUF7882 family protein n=1 Tax=Mycetocola sp. CAN_C7 TaxID=2787724 RepID=UPI0018C9AEE8